MCPVTQGVTMVFWLTVILLGLVIFGGMVSVIWTLARGSNRQRRWTLVGLILRQQENDEMGDIESKSARERREIKKATRQQHQQHHHVWHTGSGHHGSSHSSGYQGHGSFDNHHSGGHHSGHHGCGDFGGHHAGGECCGHPCGWFGGHTYHAL